MALTEIQLPIKDNFYAKLQDAANKLDKTMDEYRRIKEFIARMDTNDLDAMGVAAGQARTDLIDFRNAIDQILTLYDGVGVSTPTISPADVMDKIRWVY